MSPTASCPDWERMLGYFQEELSDAEMAAVDEHFAVCEKCIEAARAANEYALAIEKWTARSHGEAWRRELIAQALGEVAEGADQQLSDRIETWRRRMRGAVAGAVEVLVDLSGVRIVTEGLTGIVRPDAWRFEPAGAVRGAPDQHVREVGAGENAWRIRALDGGMIEIVAVGWPQGTPPPTVIVIDENGDRAPVLVSMGQGARGTHSGVFSTPGTLPGSYLIVLLS